MQQYKLYYFLTYGLFDTNILKHLKYFDSLIGQLIKFFLLLDKLNAFQSIQFKAFVALSGLHPQFPWFLIYQRHLATFIFYSSRKNLLLQAQPILKYL